MNDELEKLGKLQDYFAQYKSLPSYSYMSENLKFGAKNSIFLFMNKLKKEQYVDVAPDNKLIPGKRFFEIPFSDAAVQAGGFADPHSQSEGGYITILDILIRKPSITRIRPVKGNSMSKKGILDGDLVVYEKRTDAKVGEIVIALLDGADDVTIKELGKEDSNFVLIPHNDNFEIIRNKRFSIEGVLLSSFRTY